MDEILEITLYVTETLERLGVPYLVGGSLASSLHGTPRATQDVDLIAELRLQHVPALMVALEETFYVDHEMIRDAIRRRSSFNVIHLETMFKVDVFILKDDPASRQEMERRQVYRILDNPRRDLVIASAEDSILQKLYRYQLGAGVSDRQWNDVLGVVKTQGGQLDMPYLTRTAALLNVEDLFQQACRDAGLAGEDD